MCDSRNENVLSVARNFIVCACLEHGTNSFGVVGHVRLVAINSIGTAIACRNEDLFRTDDAQHALAADAASRRARSCLFQRRFLQQCDCHLLGRRR